MNHHSGLSYETDTKLVHFRSDLNSSGVFGKNELPTFKQVKWKLQTKGRIYSCPIVYKEIAFIGSEDGHLYAVKKTNGELYWKFSTGGAIRSAVAVSEEGYVYFTSMDGYLYAVGYETGNLLWRFKTKGEKMIDPWDYFLSSPVYTKGIVYFGSGDSNVYAINGRTGEQIWNYQTQGPVHATPAILHKTLYIGSFDGYFYALDIETGAEKWKFRTVGDTWFPRGDIQGSASVLDGIVYFGSRDYNLYAIDAETGRGKWNFKAPGTWIITTPTVDHGVLYFATSDHSQLYAVDAKTGEHKWSFPLHINTFGSSVIAGETLYFGNMNGKFYGLNKITGEQRWSFQTEASKVNEKTVLNEEGKLAQHLSEKLQDAKTIDDFIGVYDEIMSLGSIISTPFIDEGTIYFGSTDGFLYALE